ncbi:MAG: hypothetical protein H6594_01845 [Flavobacteriales bacterium]|nr:hypothetical protein [Flavobacteriales bacterium]
MIHSRSYLLLFALMFAAPDAGAQERRVLFIGNSYTYVNDLPNTLAQLALSMGDTIIAAMSAPGGYTLQQHASYPPTLNLIASQAWDFVVVQEQSQIPSFPIAQVQSDCFPFAAALVDTIHAHYPCTEAVFYMTWGRESGDALNCPNWPPVCTYSGMQALLRERYLQMAVDNDAFCAPVGAAWKMVRDAWPAIDLYAADGSHPSPAGTYLAACTMYATMLRKSCIASTYSAQLDSATAATLRMVASDLVLDSLTNWNIGVNDPQAFATWNDLGGMQVSFEQSSTGAVAHHWWFGDGAESSDPAPTHTYAGPGTYAGMYVCTDVCGRTDTLQFEVLLSAVGIGGPSASDDRFEVHDGMFQATTREASTIDIWLTDGRLLGHARTRPGTLTSIPLQMHGTTILYRSVTTSGKPRTGHLMIP